MAGQLVPGCHLTSGVLNSGVESCGTGSQSLCIVMISSEVCMAASLPLPAFILQL
jgi:hypothetical protein